jgi:hypothetical protein
MLRHQGDLLPMLSPVLQHLKATMTPNLIFVVATRLRLAICQELANHHGQCLQPIPIAVSQPLCDLEHRHPPEIVPRH